MRYCLRFAGATRSWITCCCSLTSILVARIHTRMGITNSIAARPTSANHTLDAIFSAASVMEITTPQRKRRGLARGRLMVGQSRRIGLARCQVVRYCGDRLMHRRPGRLADGVHSFHENRKQRQELTEQRKFREEHPQRAEQRREDFLGDLHAIFDFAYGITHYSLLFK